MLIRSVEDSLSNNEEFSIEREAQLDYLKSENGFEKNLILYKSEEKVDDDSKSRA
jgi:hypothetical protein